MIPIELLRVRIGLQPDDTSKDVELALADAIATATLETWLDRRLERGVEAETITGFDGDVLSLRRYPLVDDSLVLTGLEGAPEFHLDLDTGLVLFDTRLHEHRFVARYEGGYVELPPDLLGIALVVFDGAWANVAQTGGTLQAGAIRSVSVPDVGTIQYATGTEGGGGSADSLGVPDAWLGILERYRRMHA